MLPSAVGGSSCLFYNWDDMHVLMTESLSSWQPWSSIYQLLTCFLSLNLSFSVLDILYTWESIESSCRYPLVCFLALAFFPDSSRQPYVYHFFIFIVAVLLFSPFFFFVGWAVRIGLRPSHSAQLNHIPGYIPSLSWLCKFPLCGPVLVFGSSVDIWVVSTY